jgi:hypothetical protein
VKMLDMIREALSFAITTTFLTGAIVAAAAVLIALFLQEIPLRSGKGMAQKAAESKPPSRSQSN